MVRISFLRHEFVSFHFPWSIPSFARTDLDAFMKEEPKDEGTRKHDREASAHHPVKLHPRCSEHFSNLIASPFGARFGSVVHVETNGDHGHGRCQNHSRLRKTVVDHSREK